MRLSLFGLSSKQLWILLIIFCDNMARAIEEAQVKLNDGVEELMRLLLARDSPGWLQPDSQWLWALNFLFWKGMRGQVGV
jgi:hypothetical protein